MHSDPDPRLPPDLEEALRDGNLSKGDLRRLVAIRSDGPEGARERWRSSADRTWLLLFVVLFAVGLFLGLPDYHHPHSHPVLSRALGLEAGAGLLLIGRGGLLMWRPSGWVGRASLMVVLGLGLLGWGLSAITNADGFDVLAAPALVLLIGWLAVQIVRPRQSVMLARVRERRGVVTAVLVYLMQFVFIAVLVAMLVAVIGTVG